MKGNNIVIEGDIAYVSLNKGYTAIIDVADIEKVRLHTWSAYESRRLDGSLRTVYVQTRVPKEDGKYSVLPLHRFLLDAPDDKSVDHKDSDGRNNRRSNIRFATARSNSFNTRRRKDNKSGYKGVSFDWYEQEWMAHITIKGNRQSLGIFPNREQAAKAYDEAARLFFGDFACLNFPRLGEQSAHRFTI